MPTGLAVSALSNLRTRPPANSPAEDPRLTREQKLLLALLNGDASDRARVSITCASVCPVCGYNLQGLTRPVCPEYMHDLVLHVGVARLRLGWLLVALVPGFFCGIAACLLAIPTTAVYSEDGIIVWPLVGAIHFVAFVLFFGWMASQV